ncbi:UNVERIFIED_CONTAM: hypothetical protein FKN15_040734 [Acipenser sinensis]
MQGTAEEMIPSYLDTCMWRERMSTEIVKVLMSKIAADTKGVRRKKNGRKEEDEKAVATTPAGGTAARSLGIPEPTAPGTPSDSYPSYAPSAEVSTTWPAALSIRRGRSRGRLSLYHQQGEVDCCSHRPNNSGNNSNHSS